jgi:hypothetical protein
MLVCSSASLNMKLYFPALVFADLRGLNMKFHQCELVDWCFLMGVSPSEVDAASSEVRAG